MDYIDNNLVYSPETKYYNSVTETNGSIWNIVTENQFLLGGENMGFLSFLRREKIAVF